MVNNQPIEKKSTVQDGTLEVHSIFQTIQGEGPFTGTPAVFIRLAGCNLQCPACDTDYTSNRWNASPATVLEFVQEQKQAPTLVVITGGEPFRQDIRQLVETLIQNGYYVQVETNGTIEPRIPVGIFVNQPPSYRQGLYIVVSPKAGKVHPDYHKLASAFKYVLAHDSVNKLDGLPVRVLDHPSFPHVARPPAGMLIYLQPCDDKDNVVNEENLKACIRSCMEHDYVLQLQIHKLIGME